MYLKNRPATFGACAALVVAAFATGAASAGGVQFFEGSSGNHSASASFEFVGNELHITLTNTMTTVENPAWLTGLFFDIDGSPAFTGGSATANLVSFNGGGMSAYGDHTASQLWAFRDDIAGGLPFGDQQYGLGAAGFNVFGDSDMLADGGPHPQPNGIDGGILPDLPGVNVPNGHFDTPFALGSVSFVLALANGFEGGEISNVWFAFGSGFDEVNFPPGEVIPLPAALPMGLAGLAGLVVLRKRRQLRGA